MKPVSRTVLAAFALGACQQNGLVDPTVTVQVAIERATPQPIHPFGGQTVTLIGRNFSADGRLTLGDGTEIEFEALSDISLRFTAPPLEEGRHRLWFERADGRAGGCDACLVVAQPAPEIAALTPRRHPAHTPGTLRVTGRYFPDHLRARLGAVELAVESVTPTELVLAIPPLPPGPNPLTILADDSGERQATLADALRLYRSNPRFADLIPVSSDRVEALVHWPGTDAHPDIVVGVRHGDARFEVVGWTDPQVAPLVLRRTAQRSPLPEVSVCQPRGFAHPALFITRQGNDGTLSVLSMRRSADGTPAAPTTYFEAREKLGPGLGVALTCARATGPDAPDRLILGYTTGDIAGRIDDPLAAFALHLESDADFHRTLPGFRATGSGWLVGIQTSAAETGFVIAADGPPAGNNGGPPALTPTLAYLPPESVSDTAEIILRDDRYLGFRLANTDLDQDGQDDVLAYGQRNAYRVHVEPTRATLGTVIGFYGNESSIHLALPESSPDGIPVLRGVESGREVWRRAAGFDRFDRSVQLGPRAAYLPEGTRALLLMPRTEDGRSDLWVSGPAGVHRIPGDFLGFSPGTPFLPSDDILNSAQHPGPDGQLLEAVYDGEALRLRTLAAGTGGPEEVAATPALSLPGLDRFRPAFLGLATGDVTGDDRLDAVVQVLSPSGRGLDRSIAVFPGAPDGGFEAGMATAFAPASLFDLPSELAVCDLNLDGHLDVVASTEVVFGDGRGDFSVESPALLTDPGARNIRVDRTGEDDACRLLWVRRAASRPGFEMLRSTGHGDGRMDEVLALVAAGGPDEPMWVGALAAEDGPRYLLRSSDGELAAVTDALDQPEPLGLRLGYGAYLAPGDVDGDGALDAVLVTPPFDVPGRFDLLRTQGTDQLSVLPMGPRNLPTGRVLLWDADADGAPDLIGVDIEGNDRRWAPQVTDAGGP